MNIYIASSFANKQGFRDMKALLEDAGHTITHDWTLDSIEGMEPEEASKVLGQNSLSCMIGIAKADALVLLAVPDMAGAFVEMGMAMGRSKPVIVVNGFAEGNRKPLFYHLPNCGWFYNAPNNAKVVELLSKATFFTKEQVEKMICVQELSEQHGNN